MKKTPATFGIVVVASFLQVAAFPAARASNAAGWPQAAANPQGARRFLECVQMPATAALLDRYGFALPPQNSDGGRR